MVIRVFEERCTTISKDMTKLTTTPTSMFQIMERMNVSDISVRSTQAFILQQIIIHKRVTRLVCLRCPTVETFHMLSHVYQPLSHASFLSLYHHHLLIVGSL